MCLRVFHSVFRVVFWLTPMFWYFFMLPFSPCMILFYFFAFCFWIEFVRFCKTSVTGEYMYGGGISIRKDQITWEYTYSGGISIRKDEIALI